MREAAEPICKAGEETIKQKRVTCDLHGLMEGITKRKTSECATAMIENMD